jgi:hypothetical protein
MKKATDAATPQAFSRFVAVGLLSIPFQTNVRNAKASEALTKQTMAGPNSSHCAMAIPVPNGSPHSTSTEIEASHWRTILHDALTLTFTHTFAFDLGILRRTRHSERESFSKMAFVCDFTPKPQSGNVMSAQHGR